MKKFDKNFLLGASTAAHQVEGNNIHSDFWTMEHLEHTMFVEPSLDAVDHYNRFEEDIKLMKEAGLNAYRFSIEWARIEPEEGVFDENEIKHYQDVILTCKANGIEPIVTLHHFTSPKWLISKGGWEDERVVSYFEKYTSYVIKNLGQYLTYVCTINEANMGIQIAKVMQNRMKKSDDLQVGLGLPEAFMKTMKDAQEAFGVDKVNQFLSMRSKRGDELICEAHVAARKAIKKLYPNLQVGVTLSLHEVVADEANQQKAIEEWNEEFLHYLPYIKEDDFFGLQNYSRTILGDHPEAKIKKELTDMGYEFYPEALGHVIRDVAKDLKIPILVTENGVSTQDDTRRIEFINRALAGVQTEMNNGIHVIGYLHWSLLDNFEWMLGYKQHFGLIAVDRKTQERHPKPSLKHLGSFKK